MHIFVKHSQYIYINHIIYIYNVNIYIYIYLYIYIYILYIYVFISYIINNLKTNSNGTD